MPTTRNTNDIAEDHLINLNNKCVGLIVNLEKDSYRTPSVQLKYFRDQTHYNGKKRHDHTYHYSLSGTCTSGFEAIMTKNGQKIDEDINHINVLDTISLEKTSRKVTKWIFILYTYEVPVYCMKIKFSDYEFEFHFDEQFYHHTNPVEISHDDMEDFMQPLTADD